MCDVSQSSVKSLLAEVHNSVTNSLKHLPAKRYQNGICLRFKVTGKQNDGMFCYTV